MLVGLNFDGIAWVEITEEELEENDISITDEEAIEDYAYNKCCFENDSYTIGGEPSCELVMIER